MARVVVKAAIVYFIAMEPAVQGAEIPCSTVMVQAVPSAAIPSLTVMEPAVQGAATQYFIAMEHPLLLAIKSLLFSPEGDR